MAELIDKKMLRDVAVPLTKAETVNGRVYVDFQCLFEKIDELPTVTEAEIRASAIDEFAEKATKIVYEANNRRRNPQPRDMVADIHYKLRDLAEQLKGENEE